jgi:hypothetical protein
MRMVIMLGYLTTAHGVEYKPNDPAPRPGDETLDDAELARLVEVGGARDVTEADLAVMKKQGPTVAEYVAAGYPAARRKKSPLRLPGSSSQSASRR